MKVMNTPGIIGTQPGFFCETSQTVVPVSVQAEST